MCELCHGTQIIHKTIMPGVITTAPCPNCNKALKQKRVEEFLEKVVENHE